MHDFRSILRQYWGYPDFRGIQREIIESVASGHDTLGLMPTGGGKSITFQVPAMAMEGLCLVVTPLIALMKDQVDHLRRRGITAAAIYTGQTRQEINRHLDNAVYGGYKFLYVSPERLGTVAFLNKVRAMKVCLLTIDEAHCISQWGYDFRPDYLRIAEVRRLLPDVPVLALTATATSRVVADIQERLAFRAPRVFKMSFARDNLRYIVRPTEDKEAELLHILRHVAGSAIVYTRSRRATREIAELLQREGISALYYHAGLTPLDKETRQQAWQSDRVRVMVATNAFGMGIDKPDVRLVVHFNVPDSIEAYFQEAGRGGRDGQTAYAVLLRDRYDALKLSSRISQNFPDRTYIRRVYQDLASFLQIAEGEAEGRTFDFRIERFCRLFHHFPTYLISALELLTRAGYIRFEMEDTSRSRVIFLVRRDELYGIDYLSSEEERLLNVLMRSEGALFSDYVSIEEDRLGEGCNMSRDEVYQHLLHLSRLRIIQYIPRKHDPQITYTCRRLDTPQVKIPTELYERRRDLYRERIKAMIDYFSETDLCRSRYLLRYFDDEGKDCGHCDVCLDRARDGRPAPAPMSTDDARRLLLDALADGLPHPIDELTLLPIDGQDCSRILQGLADEGLIRLDHLHARLCRQTKGDTKETTHTTSA